MKEKNKKILKGLGVGALACFGMFAMTGCSVDFSKDQVDKIMYTVENGDKFMQETMDLVQKEQAWDLYRLTQSKIFLNDNNVLDNFKIKMQTTDEDGEILNAEVYSYKTTTNEYVEFTIGSDYKNLVFEQDGILYEYYKSDEYVVKTVLVKERLKIIF